MVASPIGKGKPGGMVCQKCGGSGRCGMVAPCYGTGWEETWGGTWKPIMAHRKVIEPRPFYITGTFPTLMVVPADEQPNLIG